MRIRRAEANDWSALRDVRLAALAESPDAFGSTLEEERRAGEEEWRGWATGDDWAGEVATFVADDGTGFVGMATGFHADDEPALVHLFAMWVPPERRREGIGRELVEAVVTWAGHQAGVEEVVLRVTTTNEAAGHFYVSCGFADTPDPPEPLRDGSALFTRTMRRAVVPSSSSG
jgi:RimJ/RimL family protein N-acetyltransferase